jgi:hypothetical protein
MNKPDKQRRGESPFNALLERRSTVATRTEEPGEVHVDSTPEGMPASQQPKRVSKSADPEYTKVTWYLRGSTHRRFKSAAATLGEEMSDIVERLITGWLDSQTDRQPDR